MADIRKIWILLKLESSEKSISVWYKLNDSLTES